MSGNRAGFFSSFYKVSLIRTGDLLIQDKLFVWQRVVGEQGVIGERQEG